MAVCKLLIYHLLQLSLLQLLRLLHLMLLLLLLHHQLAIRGHRQIRGHGRRAVMVSALELLLFAQRVRTAYLRSQRWWPSIW